jgi:Cu/Ag efflux pump CusA
LKVPKKRLIFSNPDFRCRKVVTKIGSGEVPTDPMPMDASDMMVILKDKNGLQPLLFPN